MACGSGRSGKSTASRAYIPSRLLKSGMPHETDTWNKHYNYNLEDEYHRSSTSFSWFWISNTHKINSDIKGTVKKHDGENCEENKRIRAHNEEYLLQGQEWIYTSCRLLSTDWLQREHREETWLARYNTATLEANSKDKHQIDIQTQTHIHRIRSLNPPQHQSIRWSSDTT